MSKLGTLTPIAAVLAVSIAGAAHAADNPFALKPVTGIVLAADAHEGKCGADKAAADKAKEGMKCGADKAKEGKCGAGMSAPAAAAPATAAPSAPPVLTAPAAPAK